MPDGPWECTGHIDGHLMGHTYAEWSDLLCERFFRTDGAGRPVTFFIDNEVLDELEGAPGAGTPSLCSAVRPRLAGEASGAIFESILREASVWRAGGGEGCPPALPFLAATVLAATRMARTQAIAANNYYARLREVLGFRQGGMPDGYGEAMQHLWPQLEWWLDVRHRGTLGRSTISGHPRLTNIGYALSQALFRQSDRERLAAFFQWIGLAPGTAPSADELVRWFRVWGPRAEISPGARTMLQEQDYWPQLGQILHLAAESWDGNLRDEDGRRLVQARLALSAYLRVDLRFVAPRTQDFPLSTEWSDQAGARIALTAANEDWYDPIPLAVDRTSVLGWKLITGSFSISFTGAGVIALHVEPQLTGFASVANLIPGEEHWVLSEDANASAVTAFLDEHALPGWGEHRGGVSNLPGWRLFRDVVVEAMPPGPVPAVLRPLVPVVQERPALRGGLRLAPTVYLCGGEPDLWVSAAAAEVHGSECTVDSAPVKVPAGGATVRLATLDLQEGHHDVRLGSARLTFSTLDGLGALVAPGTGSIAIAVELGEELAVGPDLHEAQRRVVEVRGPVVEDPGGLAPPTSPPILLPTGATEYLVLGPEPGQVARMRAAPEPRWLKQAGLVPYGLDWMPPFPAAWVLWRTATGWHCRLSDELEPSAVPAQEVAEGDVSLWRRCLREMKDLVGDNRELWARYLAVAEEVDGGEA